ncbi:Divergent AAA domain protein [Planctomycetes bacterium Pan216]|uniref:Divergent AAA domain protein n=1 Tax=Kolteria novifilia TaxID=2527975 RepID=A0A518B2S5_9BACT|nr:Divergent AAA domain protein [Planctomycetes bacterium Pan216]
MLSDKRLDDITASDIQGLIDNEVPEGPTLEYKQALELDTRDQRKEFAADVSSFANARGGDIIFGIVEKQENGKNTGLADSVVGLPDINVDQELLRIQQILRHTIEPRVPIAEPRFVDGFASGAVLVIRVGKSWIGPHRVIASSKFHLRTSSGKCELDVVELRSAFTRSADLAERIRRFRDDRLARIIAGETHVAECGDPSVVLHIVPISTFSDTTSVDIKRFISSRPIPPSLGSVASKRRPNLDGFLLTTGASDLEANYSQIFRDGCIEMVDVNDIAGHDRMIDSGRMEKSVLDAVEASERMLSEIGIDPPLVLLLSFLNVKGFNMTVSAAFSRGASPGIDRDFLLLPDVIIEESSQNLDHILRPVFDALWQATGRNQSLNYDEEGNWRRHDQ